MKLGDRVRVQVASPSGVVRWRPGTIVECHDTRHGERFDIERDDGAQTYNAHPDSVVPILIERRAP